MLFLYHVTLVKRESVNSSHKFKKQEEINFLDFQRDVSSIGLMLSNSPFDFLSGFNVSQGWHMSYKYV